MIRAGALALAALLIGPPVVAAASFTLGPEERTAARTRQYAKRQRTWFAREHEGLWPIDAARLCDRALRWYEGAP